MTEYDKLNYLIPYLDSLHDFWKERKLTKVDGEDESDEGSLDVNSLDFIRSNLLNLLISKLQGPWTGDPATYFAGQDSNTAISNLINILLPETSKANGVTSVTSKFEPTVEKYYEDELPQELHGDTREKITYSEIIKSYVESQTIGAVPEVVQRYQNSLGGNYILTMTDDTYGAIFKDPSSMNIIANFILNYYGLGNYTVANTIGLTCDAKIGLPGKIFRNIEQVYNLITPANIADSATTTFKALNNRNFYQFRSNVPSEPNMYSFTSNAFTCMPAAAAGGGRKGGAVSSCRGVNFSFENTGFNKQNPFGFILKVDIPSNGISIRMPFSSSQKQGPSVNYLVSLMKAANDQKTQAQGTSPSIDSITPSNSTILKVDKLASAFANTETATPQGVRITEGGLYDLKRSGDYEQINCIGDDPSVIFSTIDILAALYARLKQQNTMLHYNDKITMFRFPKDIDEEQLKLQALKNSSLTTIQNLTILQKIFIENEMEIGLRNLMGRILYYIENGIYVDNFLKASSKIFPPASIVNQLIKLRLTDMYVVLYNLLGTVIGSNNSNLMASADVIQRDLTLLKLFSDQTTTAPDESIKNAVEEIIKSTANGIRGAAEVIIEKYKVTNLTRIIGIIRDYKIDLTPNQMKLLKTGSNPLGLDYQFYDQKEDGVYFHHNGTYSQFKFSNSLYSTLYDIFNKFYRMITSHSRRGKKDLYQKLHDMDYFTAVTNLYNSYADTILVENVNNILVPNGATDEDCEMWYTNLQPTLVALLKSLGDHYANPANGINDDGNLSRVLITAAASVGGGRPSRLCKEIQKGGSAEIVQFYDLSDLLRKISGTASQFIESWCSERGEVNASGTQLLGIIENLKINYMPTCAETMESIRFLLSDGLMTLQNEEYYQGTTSEYMLMYILSFFTGTDKNEFESFYYDCVKKGIVDTTLQGRLIEMEREESEKKAFTSIYESSGIPADIINLLLLTFLDNTMQNSMVNPSPMAAAIPNPSGPTTSCTTESCPVYPINEIGAWPAPSKGIFYEYITSTLRFPPNNFDNRTTWERLPNYLYVYLNIIINIGRIDITKWQKLLRDLFSGGKKTRRKKRKKRKSKRKVMKKKRKSIHRKRKKRKSKNRRRKY